MDLTLSKLEALAKDTFYYGNDAHKPTHFLLSKKQLKALKKKYPAKFKTRYICSFERRIFEEGDQGFPKQSAPAVTIRRKKTTDK